MDTAKETNPSPDAERAEELLRAAEALLEKGSFLHAVETLHSGARRALEPVAADMVEKPYASREQAEARQRQLETELGKEADGAGRRGWRKWLRHAPTWVAWSVMTILILGVAFRSGASLLRKSSWRNEFSDGQWISRYYRNQRFEGE